MGITNYDDVLKQAVNKVASKLERDGRRIAEEIYPMRGGWEGWAQVEIATELQKLFAKTHGGKITVYRENRKVYKRLTPNSTLIADLVFEIAVRGDPGALAPNYYHLIVELKCQRSTGAIAAAEWKKEDDKYNQATGYVGKISIVGILCMTLFMNDSDSNTDEPHFAEYKKKYREKIVGTYLTLYPRYWGRAVVNAEAGTELGE